MTANDVLLLAGLIFAAAAVYSSVGHAGASGYIAAMALFGLAPEVMKPTALALNLMVASLATWRWHRNGHVRWPALVPLVVASIPCAFIGGAIQIPAAWYRAIVGLVLLLAGLRLLIDPRSTGASREGPAAVPSLGGAVTGGAIGLLSGLTGTGGGIFLSPMLLFFGWAGPRSGAGLVAPFILVNSAAGLAGNIYAVQRIPAELPWYMLAALLGAAAGTQLGIRWASPVTLQRILGAVLIIAAAKFLLT